MGDATAQRKHPGEVMLFPDFLNPVKEMIWSNVEDNLPRPPKQTTLILGPYCHHLLHNITNTVLSCDNCPNSVHIPNWNHNNKFIDNNEFLAEVSFIAHEIMASYNVQTNFLEIYNFQKGRVIYRGQSPQLITTNNVNDIIEKFLKLQVFL